MSRALAMRKTAILEDNGGNGNAECNEMFLDDTRESSAVSEDGQEADRIRQKRLVPSLNVFNNTPNK